jgi:hypothetical protein
MLFGLGDRTSTTSCFTLSHIVNGPRYVTYLSSQIKYLWPACFNQSPACSSSFICTVPFLHTPGMPSVFLYPLLECWNLAQNPYRLCPLLLTALCIQGPRKSKSPPAHHLEIKTQFARNTRFCAPLSVSRAHRPVSLHFCCCIRCLNVTTWAL